MKFNITKNTKPDLLKNVINVNLEFNEKIPGITEFIECIKSITIKF